MDDVNIVSVAFLVSEEYCITHYKLKDCLNVLRQNEEATSNRYQCYQYDYDFGFPWIAGSAILVLPQSQIFVSSFIRSIYSFIVLKIKVNFIFVKSHGKRCF